jgi:hypothetical protein
MKAIGAFKSVRQWRSLIMKIMSDVEREVDAIRDVLYAKTKNMTAAQRSEYFHALSEQARMDYGIWKPGQKTENIPSLT